MEFELLESSQFIPSDILEIIVSEVSKATLPLQEEDPWTAELDEEYELDYKKAQFLLLDWLKRNFATDNILYAGSGSDILPKIVLGEDVVIHTSMEDYEADKTKYFPELGSGQKVVADNVHLPFQNTSFDMVLFFGLFTGSTEEQLLESKRLIREGGLFVCDDTISENIDLDEIFADFKKISIPCYIQKRGVSETSFTVYKK